MVLLSTFFKFRVIAIDPYYKYALVAGETYKYRWILLRETWMPDEIKNLYWSIARNYRFNTSELVWVKHDIQK